MKKLKTKDLVFIAMCVAIFVVAGRIFYMISQFLPIPSSRVLTTAPLYTFIITGACLVTRKIGTISIISILYAVFMLRFSPFASIAVGLSGIFCDLVTFLIFKSYDTNIKIILSTPLRSFFSVWTSFFTVNLFVPGSRFIQAGFLASLSVSITVYLLALLSSYVAEKVLVRRIGYAL